MLATRLLSASSLLQVSVIVPLLRFCTGAEIIFYGHFPDFHLAQRSNRLRRAYRAPFDALEVSTTGAADRLLVNSLFTKKVYSATFGAIADHADVLYPCVSVPSEAELQRGQDHWQGGAQQPAPRSLACSRPMWCPWYCVVPQSCRLCCVCCLR